MVNIPGGFSTEGVGEMNDFSPLPGGEYVSQLTQTEMKDTKDTTNNNQYLNCTFEVLDGKYKGRKIFERLNLINSNPTAVEIAQKALATLCRACGKVSVQDTQELHGIPIVIKLRLKPATSTRPEENVITTYKAYDGSPVAAPVEAASVKKATPW